MRVFLKTFGCSLNRADTESITHLIKEHHLEIVDSEAEADAVVVNTCTVRGETEEKVLRYLSSLRGKRLLVTGCMAAVQPGLIACNFPQCSIVSANNMDCIIGALEKKVISVGSGGSPPPPAPFSRGLVYTIPISRGCLGECTYCIVRLARRTLVSTPPSTILTMTEKAVASGALEIRFTAQDTGVYGLDIGTSLHSLLRSASAITGRFKIRVGMFNPSSISSFLNDLLNCYHSNKIYKFAHMPLQSGSDKILESMRRGYNSEDFIKIVRRFRQEFPWMTLATDVIVGYPGELEEDFKNTLDLLRLLEPDKIHASRFSPRPHTPAASLKQVPEPVKKERSRIMSSLRLSIQNERNKRWVGKEVEATVVEHKRGVGLLARTDEYKSVLIKEDHPLLLGSRVFLEIIACSPFRLVGSVIRR
ncbi:MAG: tRNA (N(6)-L-threonylcarbamoyladenosine(37)-C(2))-methylthiotransferase [Candidatus Verstraetearchaeota archaeon]|nr:tRNA (N(6)-L-threonylcarbamoyladenosine(37)-C(2))-methylthiotransferase [Candidatus Verstraetearchaeota archaeon]